ncbi:hypothetical protein HK405_003599 [Cladochytrium tenue]|nr:hypothetical protein HK405_003599 [Cladochytrium tenue]
MPSTMSPPPAGASTAATRLFAAAATAAAAFAGLGTVSRSDLGLFALAAAIPAPAPIATDTTSSSVTEVKVASYAYFDGVLSGSVTLYNNAYEKNVTVLYDDLAGNWAYSCAAAWSYGPDSTGYEVWTFDCPVAASGIDQFYVKYDVNGATYYDNGGGYGVNYQVSGSTSMAAADSGAATSQTPSAEAADTAADTATVTAAAASITTLSTRTTDTTTSSDAAADGIVASDTASAVAPDSTSAGSSTDTHYVWAHHMVGNTYPYTQDNWASDIALASSYGIDGFALNVGSDSWQPARVADAFAAAEASGASFKLFLSLDMSVLPCASAADAASLVALVQTHAASAAHATYSGKTLVSTFDGGSCAFGTGSSAAWQSLFVDALSSAGVDIFFVPAFFTDPATFAGNTYMNGVFNWNSAWPMGDYDIEASTADATYTGGLSSSQVYMAAVSPFFFTHFGADTFNKNWIYRSDDWLYCARWEAVVAMRGTVNMVEIVTWNDYGESSYIGPIEGAMPTGSDAWVDGFPHDGFAALTKYYAAAFKTGTYPTVTSDTLVLWSRPHPKDAVASADAVGRPTNADYSDDNLYVAVLASASADVTLASGGGSATYAVSQGLTKLKLGSSAGAISATLARGGATVATYDSTANFQYTDSPAAYNFNYFVGASA